MRVTSHEEAERDVVEAIAFYREQSPPIAERLITAIEETTGRICDDPFRFPVVEQDVRRSRVNRFPYDIYYLVETEVIRVIALAHHHRHPDHWKYRLGEFND